MSSYLPVTKTSVLTTLSAGMLLALTGCGSDSDNSSSSGGSTTTPPTTTASFSQSAEWTISGDSLTPNTQTCFDFDTDSEVDCSSATWDVKFDNQTRGVNLWSNSGISGDGDGGVFGLMDWSELLTYNNGVQDPKTSSDITHHYNEDKSGGIFDNSLWYAYNIAEDHKLYPNNRVYLITTDHTDAATVSSVQQPIYAMQIINYYNEAGLSGNPTVRWIDTAMPRANQVKTKTINATSNTDWTYLNLKTDDIVNDAAKEWHVAFRRDSVKLNGGASGNDKVGGFIANTPDGYYDDKGEAIKAKFMTNNEKQSLANLLNVAGFDTPKSARSWVVDSDSSDLNPGYIGTYPNLDYGWYTYNGMTHQLSAKPTDTAQGALIRSNSGDSYARMRLAEINYPDATNQATSWVFKFDVQPAN
ncbi:HmuY family protein [Psychrobacter sp. 1U2]|uniref:HmuY family protein n=1 Tax=Psychrobacter sp. 1U2 TaxID=3453577 RepID=UPI003F465BEC